MTDLADAATLVAPEAWRTIDFISDLHLTESTPRTFALWSDYLRSTAADAVVILGDLFEFWIGDDARDEGFEAKAVDVLRDAAQRRWTGFMVGNRDFLLGDATLDACGLTSLVDPTVVSAFGMRVLLSHGDAMCIGDVSYQAFRRTVRNPAVQRDFLAKPRDERRAVVRSFRHESERRKTGQGAEDWADVDRATALHALDAARATVLVHGHTHRPGSEEMAPGRWRHVLSDWDAEEASAPRAGVLRWTCDGFMRIAPASAGQAGS